MESPVSPSSARTGNECRIEGDVEAQEMGGMGVPEGKENAIVVRTDVMVKKNWRWRG